MSEFNALWAKLDDHSKQLSGHELSLAVLKNQITHIEKNSQEVCVQLKTTENMIMRMIDDQNKKLDEIIRRQYESVGEAIGKKSHSEFFRHALQAAVWVAAILAYFGIKG
jgi:hypothetical protein